MVLKIVAKGEYKNWEGVSNVTSFMGENRNFNFAYDKGDYVYIKRTVNGVLQKKKIRLKKQHSIFGTITADNEGNFYLITGKNNNGSNRKVNTIFISKYNSEGKHIKTIGDTGRAHKYVYNTNLDFHYDFSFCTKKPFSSGTCDAAINGDILSVNYARQMYNNHQSNDVLSINTKTMKKISLGGIYNSHSFGQRVIPYRESFAYVSEGDGYDRAFTINTPIENNETKADNTFHFWVKKGTFDEYNMHILNNNFAHLGGIAVVDNNKLALVGTSAKSLSKNAINEKERLFIQIFDPTKDLSKSSSYITSGTRTGLSGCNGDEYVKNYGVKWLNMIGNKVNIKHPQIASNSEDQIVVLYEKYQYSRYKGVYYRILDDKGRIM